MLFRRPVLLAAALSAVAFIVYQFTLAPGVSFIDAGELATDCYTLGIAHPTGYPLFTLVGFLVSHLPVGSVIWRLNEMAAFFTALGVGTLFLFAREIFVHWLRIRTRSTSPARQATAKQKQRKPESVTTTIGFDPRVATVAAIATAVAAGFSETWWEQSTSIEVYPLQLFLLPLALLFFFRMLRCEDGDAVQRDGYLFALLLGLAFTNHMTTVLLAPAMLYGFFVRYGFNARAFRRIARLAPAFLAALLIYLYLPIRSAQYPLMDWGHPADLTLFLKHITGGQYKIWMFTGESAGKNWTYFWGSLPGEFSIAGVIVALAGLFGFITLRSERRVSILIFTVLLFFTCLFYSINYSIHDIDSYFLLSYLTIALWIGAGILYILRMIQRERPDIVRVSIATAALAAVLLVLNFKDVDESGNHMVDDFTKNELKSLPANAILISSAWDFFVSGALYYQNVERLRPDVLVIDRAMLRDRPWYFEHLRQRAPEVMARVKPEADAFLKQLKAFDRGDNFSPEALSNEYRALTTALVERNADRPIFVAQDFLGDHDDLFAPAFHPAPAGIAYRLVRNDTSIESPLPALAWNDANYRKRNYYTDNARLLQAAPLATYADRLRQQQQYARARQWVDLALKFIPDMNADLTKLSARDREFAENVNMEFGRLLQFRDQLRSMPQ
jgi:hypothetical protein